jgi:hypothetical protein
MQRSTTSDVLLEGGDMTLSEVADLLISPHAERLCHGNYINRRDVRGYYVQMKCGNHWCKASVSHADRNAARITAEELEAIDHSALMPPVVIPIASISSALKSQAAEQADLHTYTNSSAVDGNWSEFYFQGSWYMISVSHVDVPAYASSDELEMIADEFLRQQSGKYRRRVS